jgi:hypothetical protein
MKKACVLFTGICLLFIACFLCCPAFLDYIAAEQQRYNAFACDSFTTGLSESQIVKQYGQPSSRHPQTDRSSDVTEVWF